ncbi:MAG: hypothetical protein KKD63_15365 [Proteobacteria bacterium]|nr:hypothetical protein [Desulfobulbaceae bacterium]MBU4154248.1 hypothetical protein [Pseudomonadota bacterium]
MAPRSGSAKQFSAILSFQNNTSTVSSRESGNTYAIEKSGVIGINGQKMPISLGKINDSSPSVSHLLINHPDLNAQCWEIIFSDINQEKQFTDMRPGVEVFLDSSTKEIIWENTPSQPVTVQENNVLDSNNQQNDTGLINLGNINFEQPTLSHLLKNHPYYSNDTWDIIFSTVNRNKPYTTLQPGSQVFIDPKTLELSFQDKTAPKISATPQSNGTSITSVIESTQTISNSNGFAKRFAESVKSYLGRPYHKIDCYGLVIRGLEDLGVQYKGNNGLRQHLVQLATNQGLRHNAYHNGEGLIEVAGNKLFDESFSVINNAEQQADDVMTRIEPLLQEGVLLSFSTPSRGHTGVISQKDGEWTYVNSGVIDHQVDGGKAAKRVGEETLSAEITNWFKLARNKRTSLKVSVGIFDPGKLKEKARLAVRNDAEGKGII